jgi:outer membrane lipoprotein SlyB
MRKFILCLSLLSLAGCATGPTLYPNAKYKRVGEAQAQADIKDCQEKADAYVKNEQAKNAASGAGRGAVMGAVIGGLLGGNLRSAGRGAVSGGVVGGTAGALSPKQITQRFVTRCLGEKGYEVIGYN